MLDLAYVTTSPQGYSGALVQLDDIFSRMTSVLNIPTSIPTPIGSIDYLEALRKIKEFIVAYIQVASTAAGGPTVTDYMGQVRQIQDLVKANNSKVFPFLAVDPRREGILDLVKELVGGPKKPFLGVKLYASMGFSPTDPVLFGDSKNDDCLYRYCETQGIPITIHCSPGGSSTFDDSVVINGIIRVTGDTGVTVVDGYQGSIDSDGLCSVNGTVKFSRSITDGFSDMVRERALTLNHPAIWRRVLESYNDLYLNFAHFGGDAEVDAFIDHIHHNNNWGGFSWTKQILDLITEYKNAYA